MNIDFIEPSFPSRKVWVISALPLLLAMSVGGGAIYVHARLDEARDQRGAAELASRIAPAAAAVRRSVPPYQAQALAAVKRAASPEADALSELEHVEVAGIQVRSIDVNSAQAVVVVELDAASDGALEDYVDQLNAGDGAPRWHIQKLAARSGEMRTSVGSVTAGTENAQGHSVFISRSR